MALHRLRPTDTRIAMANCVPGTSFPPNSPSHRGGGFLNGNECRSEFTACGRAKVCLAKPCSARRFSWSSAAPKLRVPSILAVPWVDPRTTIATESWDACRFWPSLAGCRFERPLHLELPNLLVRREDPGMGRPEPEPGWVAATDGVSRCAGRPTDPVKPPVARGRGPIFRFTPGRSDRYSGDAVAGCGGLAATAAACL